LSLASPFPLLLDRSLLHLLSASWPASATSTEFRILVGLQLLLPLPPSNYPSRSTTIAASPFLHLTV
jgi:hypothetical protein